jgi:hypothetical protein
METIAILGFDVDDDEDAPVSIIFCLSGCLGRSREGYTVILYLDEPAVLPAVSG